MYEGELYNPNESEEEDDLGESEEDNDSVESEE